MKRILVLSNFYPPHSIGGYELVCAEVVKFLSDRNVDVTVLTQRGSPSLSSGRLSIQRRLFLSFPERMSSTGTFKRYLRSMAFGIWNRSILVKLIHRINPDLILVFNPSGLGALLLEWLHRPANSLGVVHDISDEWLLWAYQNDGWFALPDLEMQGAYKKVIRCAIVSVGKLFLPKKGRALALEHSYFRSKFLRDKFVNSRVLSASEAPVIYHGIPFFRHRPAADANIATRNGILFASRLSPEKGLDVLLRALRLLPEEGSPLELTIAGEGTDTAYRSELDQLIAFLPTIIHVNFLGQVSRSEVQRLLCSHCIFAFPVTWDEPFSLVLLEAMQAGAAIVATATGGSAEILRDGHNCLVAARGDAASLAQGIGRLLASRELRATIGRHARETVRRFDFESTFDQILQHLESAVGFTLNHDRATLASQNGGSGL